MPPKYLNPNVNSEGIPNAAYGSLDDLRVSDIPTIHRLPDAPTEGNTGIIGDTIDDILPSELFSQDKPKYDIFNYQSVVSVESVVSLPFKAKSIRIDNLTNQWIFITPLRLFVPPDWYGAIFSANGAQQITITYMPPPGLVNPAPTANTIVNIVASFERVPDVAGVRRL